MASEFQGYSNMMNMQERAAERVRRMQMMEENAVRRANEDLAGRPETSAPPRKNPGGNRSGVSRPERGQDEQKARHTSMPVDYLHPGSSSQPPSVQNNPPPPSPPGALLGGDHDSAMLLALILLLSRETSDPALMLALMYIMM